MTEQERLSYEEAKNHVCKNCGHYMSLHEFKESEIGCMVLDENDKLVRLTDAEVFKETGKHIGETAVFMFACHGKKGSGEQYQPKMPIEESCDCDFYEDSGR